jgi:hypothetical protein
MPMARCWSVLTISDSAPIADASDRAGVVRSSGQGVGGAEPRSARSVRWSRSENLGLGRAQQCDGQYRAPTGAEEISRPGSAKIPDHARENGRRRRAEPGKEAEPPDIASVALGELGNQGLRAGPGKGNSGAIDQLQQQ